MISDIDPRLIKDCLAGRRKAQRSLYDLSLPYFTTVAHRYLLLNADLPDTLQVTYGRLFQHLGQYDVARASFKTWSTKILINECLKQNARNKCRPVEDLNTATYREPSIPAEALARLTNEDLINWLRRMPPTYYEVFSLYVIDGFSHEEIGELLAITPVLSRKRLSRSRSWLKQRLPTHFTPVLSTIPDRFGGSVVPSLGLAISVLATVAPYLHPLHNGNL